MYVSYFFFEQYYISFSITEPTVIYDTESEDRSYMLIS